MTVRKIVEVMRRNEAEKNERGNVLRRAFLPEDRYIVDFADDFTEDGWEQYDTDQDAHYFGCWVNKRRLMTLTYAEGDWTLVECPDTAGYNAEVESMNAFYGEGKIATVIDTEARTATRFVQDREKFFIR
jgi:hypothetical protein